LNLVRLCACVAWSIVPTLADRVLCALGDASDCPRWPQHPAAQLLDARKGEPIARIEPLVTKLADADITRLECRFAGAGGS